MRNLNDPMLSEREEDWTEEFEDYDDMYEDEDDYTENDLDEEFIRDIQSGKLGLDILEEPEVE